MTDEPLGTIDTATSALQQVGEVYYLDVTGLTAGVPYYFRVTAFADGGIGFGPSAEAVPAPLPPVRAPHAPRDIAVSTASVQTGAPITHLDIAWDTPSSTGRDPVTHYLVEWWRANVVKEVVTVQVEHPTPGSLSGTFVLHMYGEATIPLDFDENAIDFRYALMTMVMPTGVIGHVTVDRETVGTPVTGYK